MPLEAIQPVLLALTVTPACATRRAVLEVVMPPRAAPEWPMPACAPHVGRAYDDTPPVLLHALIEHLAGDQKPPTQDWCVPPSQKPFLIDRRVGGKLAPALLGPGPPIFGGNKKVGPVWGGNHAPSVVIN